MFFNMFDKFPKTFRGQFIFAALITLVVVFCQVQSIETDLHASDGYTYLAVAKDLADTGIFGDAAFKGSADLQGAQGQGMFFAPLYPALVAGVMKLDPVFYENVACHLSAGNPADCSNDMGLFRVVQSVLAALSALLVWLAAWVLTHRYGVAWIALILALDAEAYAYYTAQIMTENLVFPLFTAACLSAAAAWRYQRAALWLAAGVALGLVSLTRPSYLYLFYAALPALLVSLLFLKDISMHRKMTWPLLFLAGFAIAAGPWVVRNGLSLGEYGISKGYAPFILVQRISYNDMNWTEWRASFVYGLPDFGDSLAEDLFESEDYTRLSFDNPDGFYLRGNGLLRGETLEKAGSEENYLPYLMQTYVIGDLYKHVMVTLSLAWRGMWVSKYWGLITIPIFLGVFLSAIRTKWAAFIIFSLPPWFMLGFHAFTSVNVVRYNLILIPCLAIAGGILLSAAISSIQERIHKQKQTQKAA